MNDKRMKLIGRVRGLRAKASDEACTEAEAMQAAAMAARILTENDITESEIAAMERDGTGGAAAQTAGDGTKTLHFALRFAAMGISKLTQTKPMQDDASVLYAGLDSDVEMAVYLSEMIVGAANRAYATHRKESGFRSSARMRKSFLCGFGQRVGERMRELAQERADAQGPTNTGTALVACKDALARQALDHMGVQIGTARRRSTRVDSGAYQAGRSSGDRVNLSRPVGSSGGATLALR